MKKIVMTIALALSVFTMTAQAQENQEPAKRFKGFETNSFWDNWELSFGGGAQLFKNVKHDKGPWTDRITPSVFISANKWITPIWGARLKVDGYSNKIFSSTPDPTGARQDAKEWYYFYPHLDVMANLTNWICGYKPHRFYNAVLSGGFGLVVSQDKTYYTDNESYDLNSDNFNYEYSADLSLNNVFRLSNAWNFNVEVQATLTKDGKSVQGYANNGRFGTVLSAQAGFTYKFPKRDWKEVSAFDEDTYKNRIASLEQDSKSANDRADQSSKENKQLKDQLAKERAKKQSTQIQAAEPVHDTIYQSVGSDNADGVIFFGFNKSTLNEQNHQVVKMIADKMKGSNKTYTVTGYADKQTGSKTANEKIAKKRAQSVRNALVKAGVKSSQLKVESKGTKTAIQGTKKAELNRVVIVK